MPILSFLGNFVQDNHIIFQESIDNFEIVLKTCSFLQFPQTQMEPSHSLQDNSIQDKLTLILIHEFASGV